MGKTHARITGELDGERPVLCIFTEQHPPGYKTRIENDVDRVSVGWGFSVSFSFVSKLTQYTRVLGDALKPGSA